MTDRPLRIAIVHPDLGLGGAERLVVDAAVELQARGHQVSIVTGSHNPARAFRETTDGSLQIHVRGGWIPLHVGGRLRAPAAIARAIVGALAALRAAERPDVVLCDVTPHVIPLLRALRPSLPVVFYCHYPDQLLTPRRRGWYHWYRAPIDALEEAGVRMASAVLVNSHYTGKAFAVTYPRGRTPQVVYPGVDVDRWSPRRTPSSGSGAMILSVARFERAKNVMLAVDAFAALRRRVSADTRASLRLVLAGGFDPRLTECVETLDGLMRAVAAHGLEPHVDLRPSLPDADLHALMTDALAVVCTPTNEHFGYVPVEAMACGRPVVAVAGGGFAETVVDGETGYLVPPTPEAVAGALARLVEDPSLADQLGRAGRARAVSVLSRSAFGDRLEAVVRRVCTQV